MELQRRDSRRVEQPLYDGAGVLGLEEYFADSTRLAASVLRYRFEPGASEGMHRHDATAADSCRELTDLALGTVEAAAQAAARAH